MQQIQLFEVLMNGAQATVYRASYTENNETTPVAVKVFQDKDDRDSEIAVFDRIQGIPGIVKRISTQYPNGIVLELLEQDLFEFTNQYAQPLPIEDVQSIGRQLLTTIAQLHKRGITHYDIKPENIMTCYREKIRVLNSPIQAAITGNLVGMRMQNTSIKMIDFAFANEKPQICGTQSYYPPEQLAQQQGVIRQFGNLPSTVFQITHSVDIWALACVLFELYTSVRIFDQNNDTRRFAAITQLTTTMQDLLGSSHLPANTMTQVTNYSNQYLAKGKDLKLIQRLQFALGMIKKHQPLFFDFLSHSLQYKPANRQSAEQLLQHPFIQQPIAQTYQDIIPVQGRCSVCSIMLKRTPKIADICNPCAQRLLEQANSLQP